jgi:Uma2 family endonuclease
LIEGHPIAMSPLPVPHHQRMTVELMVVFQNALRKSHCKKCRVYDPIDYKIKEDTIIQPDLLIVCEKINKAFLDFPPALVVEVLSPSTAIRDRHTKYEIYQEQGVRYYLIVDLDKNVVEIYALINGIYALQNPGVENEFEFFLDDECTVAINFKELAWE